MSSDAVTTLLAKLKSNDVDVKTDTVVRLQQEFESGAQIPDIDAATNALKSCLRTPNPHLVTATISTIRAFIPRIATNEGSGSRGSLSSSTSSTTRSSQDLRLAMIAFLASGGIIDRLGEQREPVRKIARETLVSIGVAAVEHSIPSGGGVRRGEKLESPYGLFEKYIKETGFSSKVWRVREQTLKVIVDIRGATSSFPLRPYMFPIVDVLEDSDPTVRECARESAVILFSAPGVSDVARTDLKEQMAKKHVRKAILDQVLAGLMGSSSSTVSSVGDQSDVERAPRAPSRMLSRNPSTQDSLQGASQLDLDAPNPELLGAGTSSSIDIPIVYIASARDLEHEFARMMPHFEGKETEHNWGPREQDIIRIRGMLKGEAHIKYHEAFIHGLRAGVLDDSFKALASLRTTLSTHASSLYSELAEALGLSLDPFVDSLVSHLIRMAGFTKKIVAQNSQASVAAIISHTSYQPKLLHHLASAAQDKTVAARQYAIAHVAEFIRTHGDRSKGIIESHRGLDQLVKVIRKGLSDANPGVKAKSREAYWLLQPIWPVQAQQISVTLDPTALKQLEKAKPADANIVLASAKSTPAPKKLSTSAIIAATRAKAKANAAAPPTLRHAATSGASAANRLNTSPVASLGRSSGSRPNWSETPQRRSLSPSPVSPHASSSNAPSRSVSASSTHRSPPSSYRTVSTSPSPPSSPTTELAARRKISPLVSADRRQPSAPPYSQRPISRAGGNAHARVDSARRSVSSLHRLLENDKLGLPRESLDLGGATVDTSLLMAMENPLPPESEFSDDDDDAAIEATMRLPPIRRGGSQVSVPPHPQSPPRSQSSVHTLFPGDSASQSASTRNRPSSPHSPSHDVMEDALRANAEHAESSAERLTEMLEPDNSQASLVPLSLLCNGSSSGKTTPRPALHPPVTPANPQKTKALLTQLALFQNSPAVKQAPSVMDRLYENKAVSGWWLKRKSLLNTGTPLKTAGSSQQDELMSYINALQDTTATVWTLQKLILICNSNPAEESDDCLDIRREHSLSPSHSACAPSDIWDGGKLFDSLASALLAFLRLSTDEEILEYGLCVIWEMVEYQAVFVDENEILSLLFFVRYTNTHNILEATNTIRDSLVGRQEPVWCLKTLHGCLLQYLAQPNAPRGRTIEDQILVRIRAGTHAFGIVGLGKLIMRLPPEVLEDELPILKHSLTSVLDERDPSRTTVREAAYATIVAAQTILRDETHLFELLGGLDASKKNLLTYYFDKYGARGSMDGSKTPSATTSCEEPGPEEDEVVKELLRLDAKISTPVRTRGLE